MQVVELKLKQASAVLGAAPKDLQNLVQFRLLRPRRRQGVCWFDATDLLTASIVFCLRDALGASTEALTRIVAAAMKVPGFKAGTAQILSLQVRSSTARQPIEVRIPVRSLRDDLAKRVRLADAVLDRPRGRKRPGWRTEFRSALRQAMATLADLPDCDVLAAVGRPRPRRVEVHVIATPDEPSPSGDLKIEDVVE